MQVSKGVGEGRREGSIENEIAIETETEKVVRSRCISCFE
jgi:hypothetical protein